MFNEKETIVNRIIERINAVREEIKKAEGMGFDTLKASAIATFDVDEYTILKEEASIALSDGRLTVEEAQTIQEYLGDGGPDKVNSQDFVVRLVLVRSMLDMLTS
jgi:hypothetical protein